MKTTKYKIAYIILFAAVLFCGTIQTYGVEKEKAIYKNVKVVQENDSLYVTIQMTVDRSMVKGNKSLQVIPMIQSPWGDTELPGVIFNSKRRAAYYDREQHFLNKRSIIGMMKAVKVGKDPVTVDYKYAVPVSERIDRGRIYIYEYQYGCCDGELTRSTDLLSEGLRSELAKPADPEEIRRDALSFFQPQYEEVKHRETSLKAYLNYRVNKFDIVADLGNNAAELARIDSAIAPIAVDRKIYTIKSISVGGFASPEGKWKNNEELAYNRAQNFWDYMVKKYKLQYFGSENVTINSYSEDWEGLAKLVLAGNMSGKEKVLNIIDGNDDFDVRESRLKSLDQGVSYRYIFENYYPLLRRMEISFRYDVRGLNDEESVKMVNTKPTDLSLYEMYRAYTLQGVKTDEMFMLAVHYFPNDPVALINASSVCLSKAQYDAAWEFLSRVENDPKAYNNIGLYYLLNDDLVKAESYFEKAKQTDPENANRNMMQLRKLIKQREALKNYSPVHVYKLAGE